MVSVSQLDFRHVRSSEVAYTKFAYVCKRLSLDAAGMSRAVFHERGFAKRVYKANDFWSLLVLNLRSGES